LPTEITMPILLPQSGQVIHVILSFFAAIFIRFNYFTGWVKSGVVKLLTVERLMGAFSEFLWRQYARYSAS
jgi:hypothetical protein